MMIIKKKEAKNEPTNPTKTGNEVVSKILATKFQTNKRTKSVTNEKLKIVIDSLRAAVSDESFLVFKSLDSVALNKSDVKNALDQLINSDGNASASDALAHVVLDNAGSLFSSDLIEEQQSSVECLLSVQEIIDSNGGVLGKPLVIVTETGKRVKIVILYPLDNGQVRLHFIDPFTGSRDIRSQTKKGMFEQYMRIGSEANHIRPLRGFVEDGPNAKSDIPRCESEDDSGWWCLFYCLLFIHEGVDPTSTSHWPPTNTISRIKTILATHVDFIQTSQECHKSQPPTGTIHESLDLKELRQVDRAIRAELLAESTEANNRIDRLVKMSPGEKIREHEQQIETKTQIYESLKSEIEQLEMTIKESEKALSHAMKNTGAATTESKFKQLVSGDQRRVLEAHMKKMEEKQSEILLSSNQSIREEKYREEINTIRNEKDKNAKQLENQTKLKKDKLQEIEQNRVTIEQHKNSIEDQQKEISECQKNDPKLKSELTALNNIIEDINKIDLYSNTDGLISLLVNEEKGKDVSTIESELAKLNEQLANFTSEKNRNKSSLETYIKKKREEEINRDSEESKVKESENRLSQIRSEKSRLQDRFDEYDSWWWRFWRPGTVSQVENELDEEKRKYTRESDNLETLKKNFQTYTQNVSHSTSMIDKARTEISTLETHITNTEKWIANQKENLKKKRDIVLDDLKQKKMSKSNEITENENQIIGKTKSIEGLRNQIEILEKSVKNDQENLKNIELVIVSLQKEIKDGENKIKEIEETLNKSKQAAEAKKKSAGSSQVKQKNADSDQNLKKMTRNKDKKLFFDSEILSPKDEEQLIKLCKFFNQKWKLLYRASRDKFDAQMFHSKCDGHHNSLTLICTSDSNVFGGYTSAAWSSDNCFVNDSQAFIFSLKNAKNTQPFLVRCNESTEAIYCDKQFGPCFGYDDIKIVDKSNEKVESVCKFGYSYEHPDYSFGSDEANKILAGSECFQTCEIEVFVRDYEPISQTLIESFIKKTGLNESEIREAFNIFHAIAINGEISKVAFVAYLEQKINFFKNDKELKEMQKMFELMFEKFDADSSEKLDFEEFLISVQLFDSKDANEIPKIVFSFFFEMADTDKNGVLDKNELENLLKQFPNNYGLRKLNKSFDAEISKRGFASSITKEQGVELFKNFYNDDSDADETI